MVRSHELFSTRRCERCETIMRTPSMRTRPRTTRNCRTLQHDLAGESRGNRPVTHARSISAIAWTEFWGTHDTKQGRSHDTESQFRYRTMSRKRNACGRTSAREWGRRGKGQQGGWDKSRHSGFLFFILKLLIVSYCVNKKVLCNQVEKGHKKWSIV